VIPYQRYLENPPAHLDDRVSLLLEAIRCSVERRPGEAVNAANVRHMEDFLAFLEARFPAGRFRAETQAIPKALVRTTDRNFVVTVPGRSPQRIVLVAHYDTWAGFSQDAPGADDNTSGEEVLKQFLLADLCGQEPPPLTHVYLFAGSEECGTRGLLSQVGLTASLSLISYALSSGNYLHLLLAVPFLPLAHYRFGVTGTRHFVASLSDAEKASIRAAIAVDSVGEGRLYIPENEMGANFIRALFPYEGSEALNDLLEEAAHLHDIKYNRFLSGGTTDSVAFLEERRPFPGRRAWGSIPAAALITMSPGKCSPFVAGGKLHTAHDTPDRVYARPLVEVLTILDYALHILHGGNRPACPRALSEHHYARLYQDGDELYVAAKDAVEPNRRNINSIFRVEAATGDRGAGLRVDRVVWWGVETSLDKEMRDFRPRARRVGVQAIEVTDGIQRVRFAQDRGLRRRVKRFANAVTGRVQRLMGRYSFLAMFATAFVVSWIPTKLLEVAMYRYPPLASLVGDQFIWMAIGLVAFQLGVLFRLFTRELPTWMDNAYRHENQACNLLSLKRTGA